MFGRTSPYTLGLLGRKPVPKIDGAQKLEALIEAALILGEQPDEARWAKLAERAGNRPIWMLNFLEFAETAVYANDAEGAAPQEWVFGTDRPQRRVYWFGRIESLGLEQPDEQAQGNPPPLLVSGAYGGPRRRTS